MRSRPVLLWLCCGLLIGALSAAFALRPRPADATTCAEDETLVTVTKLSGRTGVVTGGYSFCVAPGDTVPFPI